MEKYIKPSIKVKEIDVENLLAAESPVVQPSKDPSRVQKAGDDEEPQAKQNFNSWSED